MANVIENVQKPTLVISHNKTLAAQLYEEFKDTKRVIFIEFYPGILVIKNGLRLFKIYSVFSLIQSILVFIPFKNKHIYTPYILYNYSIVNDNLYPYKDYG